jgi:prepilin-type N-terminal cleavage/methylation domain-containing protein
MHRTAFNSRGFSLVELMVAMAIAGFAMAGIYGVYNAQVKTHVTQGIVVDNQQNLRNAMFIISNAVRMAGYDPSRGCRVGEDTDGRQRLGLFTAADFSTFCTGGIGSPLVAVGGQFCVSGFSGTGSDSDSVAFALDWNGDDTASGGVGMVQALDTEVVAFRLNAATNTVERYGARAGWQPVAENIDSLAFLYFDQNGAEVLPTPPAATLSRADLANVRSIHVAMTAVMPREVSGLAGNKAAGSLSALVKMRNSGLP